MSFGRVSPEIHHQEIFRLHSLSDQDGCNKSASEGRYGERVRGVQGRANREQHGADLAQNKSELTEEDYNNFYMEKRYGFDKPLKHLHISADGAVVYNAILFIPESTPFDYYTKEYEKGLELYSNGVLIMDKCGDLLPDYFGFVKGMVDSEDLSLNISREMLQHDRQLSLIAKNIKTKSRANCKAC